MSKSAYSFSEIVKKHIYSMKSREIILGIREKRLRKLTRALKEKEEALREKEIAFKERDQAIHSREIALAERDRAIVDRDEAIKDTFIDSLTGCYNRNYFEKIMSENYNANLNHNKIGLIFIDINDLKEVNDKLGHDAGDKLIRDTANFLKTNFRKDYDTVIRLGGDEFVVVCYNYRETAAFEKGLEEKIIRSCEKFPSQFAFGIAVFSKYVDDNLEDTKNRADKLMYECKMNDKKKRELGQIASYSTAA